MKKIDIGYIISIVEMSGYYILEFATEKTTTNDDETNIYVIATFNNFPTSSSVIGYLVANKELAKNILTTDDHKDNHKMSARLYVETVIADLKEGRRNLSTGERHVLVERNNNLMRFMIDEDMVEFYDSDAIFEYGHPM